MTWVRVLRSGLPLQSSSSSILPAIRASCQQHPCTSFHQSSRLFSSTSSSGKEKEPPSDGIKSTYPSSEEPEKGSSHTDKQAENPRGDRGHLSFTKASLFKLTLPLHSDASDSTKDSPLQIQSTPTSERAHSVVFLLHGGQPLSYIASLIRAEAPSPQPGASQSLSQDSLPSPSSNDSAISSSNGEVQNSPESVFVDSSDSSSQSSPSPESPPSPGPISKKKINDGAKQSWETQAYADESKDREDEEMDYRRSSSPALGTPPITFHTKSGDGKRWSPSTGIGDFLRDAARAGSFVISVGNRAILISVPSFEDRTRFLRSSLYAKTDQIEVLSKLKGDCDSIAHKSSRRLAFGGLGILATWWITCGYLTFFTELGWDTLEPVSYLVGLATLGAGYSWFLAHNRDISYRAVMSESTSRRQQILYSERGFNPEVYQELIEDVKELRKTIKRIAQEYGDQKWDQGDTNSGQQNKRALSIIRSREARENGPSAEDSDKSSKDKEGGKDKGGDEEGEKSKEMELDDDGDGIPDGKQKKERS